MRRFFEIMRGLLFTPILLILVLRDLVLGDLDRTPEPVTPPEGPLNNPARPRCPDYDPDCVHVEDCLQCAMYAAHMGNGFIVYCPEYDRREQDTLKRFEDMLDVEPDGPLPPP